jgi:ribonuclease Y
MVICGSTLIISGLQAHSVSSQDDAINERRLLQEQAKAVAGVARKRKPSKEAILQAKDSLSDESRLQKETKETRKELQILEKRLLQKDENLEKSRSLWISVKIILRDGEDSPEQESDLNERGKFFKA